MLITFSENALRLYSKSTVNRRKVRHGLPRNRSTDC